MTLKNSFQVLIFFNTLCRDVFLSSATPCPSFMFLASYTVYKLRSCRIVKAGLYVICLSLLAALKLF